MKKIHIFISLMILAAFVLGACGPAATPEPTQAPPTEAPMEEPTEAPMEEPTEAPMEEPTEEPAMELPDLGGRVITVAIENAYLPFNYVRLDTGEAEGWDYDFLNEACARLNCEVEWIQFGWDTMITAVGDGQFDMAADGITITEERAEVVDFSDGYVSIEQRILARIDEDRFDSPESFAANPELIFGEQVGTTNYLAAVELVGEDRVVTYDDFGFTVQALIAGDVDGVVIDEVAGLGYLGANKDELKLVGESMSSDELGFIFPKGSDLVEPFNMVIAQMKADGWLEANNTKWFGPSFTLTYDDIGPGAYAEEEGAVDIGTEENPIKVLFVPSVDVDFMIESGGLIEQGLYDATGLYYEVSVPTSYAATIEEMCASPDDTVGFIPAMGYVLANSLCGVEPGLASERYGWNVYWTEFLVARDSDFQTFEDLEGASWAYPDATSTSGYLYPLSLFDDLGITVGETVEAGGHPQAVKAVYNGEADFGTAYFSAPLLPEGTWSTDMPPDVPDDVVADCAVNEEGQLWCGDYRVLDARAAITDEAPDVVQKVRILGLSPEIPNDTLSFAPGFPEELREEIMNGIIAFIDTEECEQSLCNEKFYDWTGAGPIFDENFDGIRILMEAQGITLENIGE
jgi:phosphate/phosphite/phosphonate ABC transporter binding protein